MAETGCGEHNKTLDTTIGGNSPLELPLIMMKSKKLENGCADAGCKNGSNLDRQLKKKSVSTMIQEDVGDVGKLKKKRPFKPAENLWCFSIEDTRYDFHESDEAEYANKITSQQPVMSSVVWDENSELLADIYSHGRATNVKRSNKEPKVLKQLKDVHYRTKQIKQMNTGGNNKLLVKSDAYSRKVIHDNNMTQAFEAKKVNIEKVLEKKDLKRRGIKEPTLQTTTDQTPSKTKSKIRRKPRWSLERKEDRVIYWEAYPLYALNEESSDDPETQLLWLLLRYVAVIGRSSNDGICLCREAEIISHINNYHRTDFYPASIEMFKDPCIIMESYEVSHDCHVP